MRTIIYLCIVVVAWISGFLLAEGLRDDKTSYLARENELLKATIKESIDRNGTAYISGDSMIISARDHINKIVYYVDLNVDWDSQRGVIKIERRRYKTTDVDSLAFSFTEDNLLKEGER